MPWWIAGLWHLEVAQRFGAALASFDRQLNRAASTIGVALFSQP